MGAAAVPDPPTCCQLTTTLPERAAADRLAATLVEEGWAACAQVTGPVESTYRWQGTIERAAEWYCHLKTTLARVPGLRARIRELHPYAVPEIVAVPFVDGDPDYLRWIEASVSGGP
jgi:periplasmic divalent cation tolerance protein